MRLRTGRVVWVWTSALLVLTACQSSSSHTARSIDIGPPRYEVACPSGEDCNASVALLVGLSAPTKPTRCTAALIGPRTAITAGHCVAPELFAGGACHDVWLGFAGTEGRPPMWVGCERIVSVSEPGATLLSPDYAILELAENTPRPWIPLGDGDVALGEVVQMITVTADRFYDDVHQVRSRRCVVDDGRQLSPWAEAPPNSIRVLSSCPIRPGSSGAPVLDSEGRLRGLVHAGGPPFFAFGLMTLLPQPVERDDG
ncbi:MAG: serine protease [Myxococcales bacterium]|nr:MAG: serine protease [Myxococcales bacterium]